MPISNVAVAAPPSTRYLSAASVLCTRMQPEQHQRVHRQRHDLDAEEQRREAGRRHDQAGAIQRSEHQRVVGRLGEIVARDQQHGQRERDQHRLRQRGRGIDQEVLRKRLGQVAHHEQPQRRRRGSPDRQHCERKPVAGMPAPDLEPEDREHADEQQVLGQHRGEDDRPVHGVFMVLGPPRGSRGRAAGSHAPRARSWRAGPAGRAPARRSPRRTRAGWPSRAPRGR